MIKSSIQNLKEKIRSRRGIAMELAIIVMLISVAFSLLLTTVLTIQNKKTSDIPNELSEKIAIDQAGEQLLKVSDGTDTIEVDGYKFAYTKSSNEITIDGKSIDLTIKIENNKISSWSYK